MRWRNSDDVHIGLSVTRFEQQNPRSIKHKHTQRVNVCDFLTENYTRAHNGHSICRGDGGHEPSILLFANALSFSSLCASAHEIQFNICRNKLRLNWLLIGITLRTMRLCGCSVRLLGWNMNGTEASYNLVQFLNECERTNELMRNSTLSRLITK